MSWLFCIRTGTMYSPDRTQSWKGYTGGELGQRPDAVNNPDDEALKDIGPLPEGWYTFGEPVEHSKLGVFAIPLIPDATNDMKGRGGFFCHGDLVGKYESASEGCIIMPHDCRIAMWISTDHRLQVVADYQP
jgi:hypothetical protein